MANEANLRAARYRRIRETLRGVGYELVQIEPSRGDTKDKLIRPDILAWAANADGELVPWATVEVKSGKPTRPEGMLPALARTRDLLGTVDHYVVQGDEWFKATEGLRDLVRVPGPTAPEYGGDGELADVSFATSLVTERLWEWADQRRGQVPASRIDFFFPQESLPELQRHGIETRDAGLIPVKPEVLWEARRAAMIDFARRSREAGVYASHPVVARAVAELVAFKLTWDLCDPFCGTGAFLWEAVDVARERGHALHTVYGVDLDWSLVKLARTIGDAAPIHVDIRQGDAFVEPVPLSTAIVSAPPLGLRLNEPYLLMNGAATKDGDVATVDRIVQALGDGGRAVIQIPLGLTFRAAAARYRDFLADRFWISALIGLPSGSFLGTRIGSVLLVIDNVPPRDTFVAQLGEDWESQLAPGGAALTAALEHIDGLDSNSGLI